METFQRAKAVSDAPIHHITDEDGIVATDPVAKLVLRVKCIYKKLEFKFYKENLLSFGKKNIHILSAISEAYSLFNEALPFYVHVYVIIFILE